MPDNPYFSIPIGLSGFYCGYNGFVDGVILVITCDFLGNGIAIYFKDDEITE